jgi:hypothetical protein
LKRFFVILLGLMLVLAQSGLATDFAPVTGATAATCKCCGCGGKSCCLEQAPASPAPAPLTVPPAPTASLLLDFHYALDTAASLELPQPIEASPCPAFPSYPPCAAPLFQRDCAFLI